MSADYGAVPPPPPPPPYQPPRQSSNALIIVIAIVVAVAVVAGVGVLAVVIGRARAGTPTHAVSSATPRPVGPLQANSGTVVFSDDFHDSSSGWSTATLPSGTVLSYKGGKYVILAKGDLHHYAEAPYQQALRQVSASVTGTQSADAPDGAGFGVTCRRGVGAQQVRYQFLVLTGGQFFVEAGAGADSSTTIPVILKQGTSPVSPGATAMTVVGACMSETDGKTTRLVLFVNGTSLADVTDVQDLAGSGWLAGIDVASRTANASTVTVTRFEERNPER
jgi:hypothetical protein